MSNLTTAEVAERLRCEPKTVAAYARRFNVGFKIGRRGGWRFSEADVERIVAALSPQPLPAQRRRRRRSA